MGLFDKLGQVFVNSGRYFRYGKQIGQMSSNGRVCFARSIRNGGTSYTTIEARTGKLVTKKVVYTHDNGYRQGTTWDAKGNVTSTFEHTVKRRCGSHASNNKLAGEFRNIRDEYNKLGQTTFHSDVTFKPTNQTGWLAVDSCVNRKSTEMMVNGCNRLILNG